MTWARIQCQLFPGDAERDEGFRQELLKQSHVGLQALSAVGMMAPAFLAVTRWLLFSWQASAPIAIVADIIVVAMALISFAMSRVTAIYPYSRVIALVLTEVVSAVLLFASLYRATIDTAAETFIPGQMALAGLIIAVTVPLLPWQAFFHCAMIASIYIVAVQVAAATFLPGATIQPEYLLFMGTLALLATGLAAVMYGQRRSAYVAYLQTLHAADELRKVQQRLALSESASSMARLSAAISHELNTPVGALKSAVDTLLLLGSRQATAPPEQVPRLLKLQSDLRRSIQESASRLQEIAARVARFTNLDQAEMHQVCVNDLLSDVAALLRSKLNTGRELKLDLAPVSKIVANPQRLSSVFFDLINNSVGALNGKGMVEVRTRQKASGIEVVITDNGRGIEHERLAEIFEPGFHETSGRIAVGNWSMFNARQTVREQGGEIAITSEPGVGTTVTISLPFGQLT